MSEFSRALQHLLEVRDAEKKEFDILLATEKEKSEALRKENAKLREKLKKRKILIAQYETRFSQISEKIIRARKKQLSPTTINNAAARPSSKRSNAEKENVSIVGSPLAKHTPISKNWTTPQLPLLSVKGKSPRLTDSSQGWKSSALRLKRSRSSESSIELLGCAKQRLNSSTPDFVKDNDTHPLEQASYSCHSPQVLHRNNFHEKLLPSSNQAHVGHYRQLLKNNNEEGALVHSSYNNCTPPAPIKDDSDTNAMKAVKRAQEDYCGHPTFPHCSVIRRKEDRERLRGHDCEHCGQFYSAITNEGNRSAIRKLVSTCSRHRYLYSPPETPPDFWDPGFPETQENS